jgi:hypothetical protein
VFVDAQSGLSVGGANKALDTKQPAVLPCVEEETDGEEIVTQSKAE